MKQKLLCAFLLATSGISQSANVSAPEPERAIWIWEKDSYAMLEDRSAADDAIRFLNSKHINTIYLYADTFDKQNLIVSQPQMYSHLIQRLHKEGIHTYALLGSAYLHTEEYILPEHRSAALSIMQRVLDFNSRTAPDERFDGVNLDIEPHILDLWPAQKIQLLEWFLDMSQSLMELKKASGQTLSVGPAIPFWLDSIELEWHGQTKRVSDHVQDIYDYVNYHWRVKALRISLHLPASSFTIIVVIEPGWNEALRKHSTILVAYRTVSIHMLYATYKSSVDVNRTTSRCFTNMTYILNDIDSFCRVTLTDSSDCQTDSIS